MKYKFSESLKKNCDFQYVYRNGKSYANKYLVMYILENHGDRNRLGISVSKKVALAGFVIWILKALYCIWQSFTIL